MCAVFRTANCAAERASSEMFGLSHRRKGTRNRDVRFGDPISVEPMKIRHIHSTTGKYATRRRRIPNKPVTKAKCNRTDKYYSEKDCEIQKSPLKSTARS
jgi:hypothetical protein